MKIQLYGTRDQAEIVKCRSKFISVFAGRRWGKTYTARNRIISRVSQPNFLYWYVTPGYAQCKKEFKALATNKTFRRFIKNTSLQPYPKIELINGSEIGYRSFYGADSLRGDGIDEVWFDEIQDANEDQFNSVILPLLSDSVLGGTLVMSGQFRGENWYYKKYYLPGLDPEKPDYTSFRFPTSSGIMFQSERGKVELERIKETMPRIIYETEYECLPLANQAAVFNHEDLARVTGGESGPASQYKSVCFGLDLGRVVDPSAMVGIDAQTMTVVFAEKRPLGEKHQIGAEKAADTARRYGNATIIVDTTGGATGGKAGGNDAYVKYYREKCPTMRAFTITGDNKERIIANLSLAIEQNRIKIPEKYENLHKELALYEYIVSKNGRVTYQGPGGHNDDMVIALALAWEGISRGWYGNGDGSGLGRVLAGLGG